MAVFSNWLAKFLKIKKSAFANLYKSGPAHRHIIHFPNALWVWKGCDAQLKTRVSCKVQISRKEEITDIPACQT